ncbi:Fur-regulated basic protein FbpA [Bacillus sp. 03113]|uniref:Fur-regulated basic protein FbpA n=1 Tax=Bacillus sp. 03113 TaxID=2578211 RepID=UPI0015E89845|nr:Fur-regulated basic protein FbpA [Bacillus sp. 03113]
MSKLLQHAIKKRKSFIVDFLVDSGAYFKEKDKLIHWTLTELEEEYRKHKVNRDSENQFIGQNQRKKQKKRQ